jgi:hypothetical protein
VIGKIWFNSGRSIGEYFNQKPNIETDISLNMRTTNDTSIKQGVTFESYAIAKGLWDKNLIVQGQVYTMYGLEFQILSPSENELKSLLSKWKSESDDLNTSTSNDYSKSILEHAANDKFTEDTAVHNSSSIAFILTYKNKSFLFLADSHPNVIIRGLSHFGYNTTNRLSVDFVKVSHHGSKFNTSKQLLEIIDSEIFIISSNGQIHNLPDKQCLARIIAYYNNPRILFNYPALVPKIFSEEDFASYRFSVDQISKLNFACD